MKKNVITKAAAIITLIIMIFASCSQPDMKDKMTVNEVLYPFFKLVENEDGDWEIKVIAGSGMSDVTVPDSLKTPNGSNATIFGGFESESDRKGVQTVTIEDGITEIKDGAFQGASNLTDVKIEDNSSLTTVGDNAFSGTSNLGSVDFGSNSKLESIGEGAFGGSGLSDVKIPSSVTEIGNNAFAVNSLKNLTISADKANTDDLKNAFGENYLDALESVTVTAGKENDNTIGSGAFSGAQNLTSVVIADGVEGIASGAFTDSAADNYTLPSSLTNVEEGAFDNDDNVYMTYDIYTSKDGKSAGSVVVKVQGEGAPEDIIDAILENKGTLAPFPNAVLDYAASFDGDVIGKEADFIASETDPEEGEFTLEAAFPSSSSDSIISGKLLVSWIDESLEYVYQGDEKGTFHVTAGEIKADTVYVGGSHFGKDITGVENDAFKDKDVNVVFSDPSKITEIGSGAFQNNGSIKDDILAGFTNENLTIGDNAFAGTGMSEATIPSTIEDVIPEGLFNGASNLGTLKTPDGKESTSEALKNTSEIGNNAFKDTSLTGNPLENNNVISSIGNGAFQGADLGPVVTIPSSVGTLGDSAFADNDGITSVIVEPNANKDITGEDIAKGFATITGSGTDEDPFKTENAASTVKELTIPVDMIQSQKDVDALYEAFPNLEKITITGGADDSVTTIPSDVSFSDFDTVKGIVIEEGITGISTTPENGKEGNGTFAGMDNLTSVTLPEGLTDIGDNAFNGNKNLTDITTTDKDGKPAEGKLPSTVTNIGDNAFAGTGLGRGDSSVSGGEYDEALSGSEDAITGGLFENIEGPLTIGSGAFADTEIGPTVNLPDTTTSVGEGAFAGVSPKNEGENGGLNVKVPAGVTGDPDGETGSAGNFVDIFIDPENAESTTPVIIDNLIITGKGDGNNTVGQLTDKDPVNDEDKKTDLILDNVVVGEGVTDIGDNAFTGVGTLDDEDDSLNVKLPDSLTNIGDSAFENAPAVVNADGSVVDSSNKKDGDLNISSGKGEGVLPPQVESVGNDAFKNTNLDGDIFDGNDGSLTTIGSGAFENTDLGSVKLPDSVTSVGDGAFAGNDNIKDLVIGDGVFSTLDEVINAFGKDEGDGNMVVDSVTNLSIPEDLFNREDLNSFPSLSEITITPADGDSSTGPVELDFSGLKDLEKVTIDEGVDAVFADGAFKDTSVKEIGITANILNSENGGEQAEGIFSGSGLTSIAVEKGSDNSAESITIPGGAFAGADAIENVTIGEGILVVGDTAENGESIFDSAAGKDINVKLPGSVTTIGSNAFAGDIVNVDFAEEVTSSAIATVGDNAFRGNTSIDDDFFGKLDNLTNIGDNAFSGTSITGDPLAGNDKVTTVGSEAFQGTDLGPTVTIPGTVGSLGESAFADSTGDITTIVVEPNTNDGNPLSGSDIANAFTKGNGDGTRTSVDSVTSLTIPVDMIQSQKDVDALYEAFPNLEKITITGDGEENGITAIPENVTFKEFGSLSTVEIENGVTSIGSAENASGDVAGAFEGMDSLTTVILPEGLTVIGDDTFSGCTNLTNVSTREDDGTTSENELPSSLETVGENAFNETKVTGDLFCGNDGSLLEIGNGAFANVTTQIGDEKGVLTLPSANVSIGSIVEDGTNDVEGAFEGVSSITGIKLPENANVIYGDNAFKDTSFKGNPLDNQTVTAVGDGAFQNTGLGDTVTIPASVKDIGESAFADNDGITTVIVEQNSNGNLSGDDVAKGFATITGNAENGFSTNNPADNVTRLEIPADMIKDQADVDALVAAFPSVTELVITGEGEVTLPGNVSFAGFENLDSVEFGEGIISVNTGNADGPFADSNVTTVILPEGLGAIGDNVFNGCTDLTNVATREDANTVDNNELPSSLTTIGDNAFNGTSIEGDIFKDNSSLTTIGDGAFANVKGELGENGVLTLPTSVTTIGSTDGTNTTGAFEGTTSITEVVLPEGLTTIGDNTFSGNNSLEKVSTVDTEGNKHENVLPGTVTNIGDSAFADTSLKSPAGEYDETEGNISGGLFERIENNSANEGLTIGDGAFANTNVGPVVNIPSNTASVGNGAFSGLKDNTTGSAVADGELDIKVPVSITGENGIVGIFTDGDETTLNAGIISITTGNGENETVIDSLTGTGDSIIVYDKVVVEDGISGVVSGAFDNVSGKDKGAFIVDSLTDDATLTSSDFGGTVDFAISDESGKTNILVGDSVNEESVSNIAANNTLNGPVSTITISADALTEEVMSAIKNNAEFDGLKKIIITAGDGDGNATIQSGVSFSGFEGITVEFADDVKNIAVGNGTDKPFEDAGVTTVILPEGLETIGDNVFNGCTDLTNVATREDANTVDNNELPSSLTTIGDNAFNGTSIEGDIFKDNSSLTTIGDGAFANVKGELGENGVLTLPTSVTTIGSTDGTNTTGAFEGTTSITEVVLPEGLTTIGDNTFSGCTNLASLGKDSVSEALKNVAEIGKDAFSGTSITGDPLADNDKVTSVGDGAFQGTNIGPTVTIPGTVGSIGQGAFADSKYNGGIKNVVVEANDNAGITGDDIASAFKDAEGNGTQSVTRLEIPADMIKDQADVDALVAAFPGVTEIVITGEGDVRLPGNVSFAGFENLDSVEFGEGIISVNTGNADGPFADSKVTTVILPDSLTTIGDNIFKGSSLTEVTIPASVKTIGESAFSGCDSLGKIIFEERNDIELTIGENAFNNCGNLDTVVANGNVQNNGTWDISDLNITSIGSGAFVGISDSVNKVVLPSEIGAISNDSFSSSVGYEITLSVGNFKYPSTSGDVTFSGKFGNDAGINVSKNPTAQTGYNAQWSIGGREIEIGTTAIPGLDVADIVGNSDNISIKWDVKTWTFVASDSSITGSINVVFGEVLNEDAFKNAFGEKDGHTMSISLPNGLQFGQKLNKDLGDESQNIKITVTYTPMQSIGTVNGKHIVYGHKWSEYLTGANNLTVGYGFGSATTIPSASGLIDPSRSVTVDDINKVTSSDSVSKYYKVDISVANGTLSSGTSGIFYKENTDLATEVTVKPNTYFKKGNWSGSSTVSSSGTYTFNCEAIKYTYIFQADNRLQLEDSNKQGESVSSITISNKTYSDSSSITEPVVRMTFNDTEFYVFDGWAWSSSVGTGEYAENGISSFKVTDNKFKEDEASDDTTITITAKQIKMDFTNPSSGFEFYGDDKDFVSVVQLATNNDLTTYIWHMNVPNNNGKVNELLAEAKQNVGQKQFELGTNGVYIDAMYNSNSEDDWEVNVSFTNLQITTEDRTGDKWPSFSAEISGTCKTYPVKGNSGHFVNHYNIFGTVTTPGENYGKVFCFELEQQISYSYNGTGEIIRTHIDKATMNLNGVDL